MKTSLLTDLAASVAADLTAPAVRHDLSRLSDAELVTLHTLANRYPARPDGKVPLRAMSDAELDQLALIVERTEVATR